MKLAKYLFLAIVLFSLTSPAFVGCNDRYKIKNLFKDESSHSITKIIDILGAPCEKTIRSEPLISNDKCSSAFSDLSFEPDYSYYFWAKGGIPYYWVCVKVDDDKVIEGHIRIASFF